MKTMQVYVFVALLPLLIRGQDDICEILENMANEAKSINSIFQPSKNGFLGKGAFGVTYKGTLLHPIRIEVAMKFTKSSDEFKASMEYEIYTCLGAINDCNVEKFGIPAVYYYGKWENFILMAITLLDTKLNPIPRSSAVNEIDVLILFREFVRISKYIHSNGVCHNDIKFDNMMFRGNQLFIIDFNMATKMFRRSDFGDSYDTPRTVQKYAKEDWERFLYSICEFIGISFDWISIGSMNEIVNSDIFATIKKIENIKYNGLKRVFVEFAKYVFNEKIKANTLRQLVDPNILFYDQMYQVITEDIEKIGLQKPILVSWLTNDKRGEFEIELKNNELPDIASIKNCFEKADYKYPKVNFTFFQWPSIQSEAGIRVGFTRG